jgi:hypothetical protein
LISGSYHQKTELNLPRSMVSMRRFEVIACLSWREGRHRHDNGAPGMHGFFRRRRADRR